jgi:hypothetical protein
MKQLAVEISAIKDFWYFDDSIGLSTSICDLH